MWNCKLWICGSIIYILCKIMCNPMHPLLVLYLGRMCQCGDTHGQCGLHEVMWFQIGTLMPLLAAEPRSTPGLFFLCQYLCGTILVTPYEIVRDWWVSRAGYIHFYWPWCSLPFCLPLFFISLLSFYEFVLWGWGLRTNRVLIALSQPCIANLFN